MKQLCLISFVVLFFTGCVSHTPAPVINRSPQVSKPSSSDDWRPNTYTVKKGDTLYSIGLEYGYDYREIAAANNIYEPFTILIGQRLDFSSLNTKDSSQPTTYENTDGVIVSPVETETPTTTTVDNTSTSPAPTTEIAVLSSPKAVREPYSLEAYNRTYNPSTAPATQTAKTATQEPKKEAPKTETTPDTTTPTKTKPAVVDGIAWTWPTQGKVSAKFNAASNKGIDIAGKKGQAITASSAGKVIYTGSDLRGYGKLVIVKHSKTFLSVYAHNSKINVKEGQLVKSGQKIAEMGNTDTDKIKLHFEIRQKGKSVDPARFLPKS